MASGSPLSKPLQAPLGEAAEGNQLVVVYFVVGDGVGYWTRNTEDNLSFHPKLSPQDVQKLRNAEAARRQVKVGLIIDSPQGNEELADVRSWFDSDLETALPTNPNEEKGGGRFSLLRQTAESQLKNRGLNAERIVIVCQRIKPHANSNASSNVLFVSSVDDAIAALRAFVSRSSFSVAAVDPDAAEVKESPSTHQCSCFGHRNRDPTALANAKESLRLGDHLQGVAALIDGKETKPQPAPAVVQKLTKTNFEKNHKWLCGLTKNRHVLSPDMGKVEKELAAKFNAVGKGRLKVNLMPFSLHQDEIPDFYVPPESKPSSLFPLRLNNVEAVLPGESDQFIVFCAHLDSTAHEEFNNKYNPLTMPAPGANDDGSGVAAVLTMAEILCADSTPLPLTVRFLLFNAEEEGLLGSKYYCDNVMRDSSHLCRGAFMLDMISYRGPTGYMEIHVGLPTQLSRTQTARQSEHIAQLIYKSYTQLNPRTIKEARPFIGDKDPAIDASDHSSFHAIGVPAVVVSENYFIEHDKSYPNYHLSKDAPGNAKVKLDMDYASDMARIVLAGGLCLIPSPPSALVANTKPPAEREAHSPGVNGTRELIKSNRSASNHSTPRSNHGLAPITLGVEEPPKQRSSVVASLSAGSFLPLGPRAFDAPVGPAAAPGPMEDDESYMKVAAWFLGPKGENKQMFEEFIDLAVQEHCDWRNDYYPQDSRYVTEQVKASSQYKGQVELIRQEMKKLLSRMRNSTPFFSSRYKGHMNWDVSMIGCLGYFMTTLWNGNNVAVEASPFTTMVETEVGKQLCTMLGYAVKQETFPAPGPSHFANGSAPSAPIHGWGHITSCGSVANIEALWAARNLRYLSLAIQTALRKEATLKPFQGLKVKLCTGQLKQLITATAWEAVNITSDEIVQAYADLQDQCQRGQVTNLPDLVGRYDVSHSGLPNPPGKYLVPASRHYSWDKAGALLGIGQSNMITVRVDELGRMDARDLASKLRELKESKVPVIAVVAVMGSTSESAVDPLSEIVSFRQSMRKQGLDFFLHADAAWGGYFCSMLRAKPTEAKEAEAFVDPVVPTIGLSDEVTSNLNALKSTDSITIDPHKSGYIQYPAGALCYRNGAVRFLLTFKAPIVSSSLEQDVSIGFFGVEGSKPAAAAVATYLHHTVVGLHKEGHGQLLGEVVFGAKLLYCMLNSLAKPSDPIRLETLQKPVGLTRADLDALMKMSNREIRDIPALMEKLRVCGPDLLINSFSFNFKWPLLVVNDPDHPHPDTRAWQTDKDKINAVLDVMADDLNVAYAIDSDEVLARRSVGRQRLFMIRNTLDPSTQSAQISQLARRLGLKDDNKPLKVMVSTNMDPWPTATGFLPTIRYELRQSILRAIGAVMEKGSEHFHGFAVADAKEPGRATVFGDHLPVFSEPIHQYHGLAKFEILAGFKKTDDGKFIIDQSKTAEQLKQYYLQLGVEKNSWIMLSNHEKQTLSGVLHNPNSMIMNVWAGFPQHGPDGTPLNLLGVISAAVLDIVHLAHFDPADSYPPAAKYYLFGNPPDAVYMSHCMTRYPDHQHLAKVTFTSANPPPAELIQLGIEITLNEVSGQYDASRAEDKDPMDPSRQYKFTYTGVDGAQGTGSLSFSTIYYDTENINTVEEMHHESANQPASGASHAHFSAPNGYSHKSHCAAKYEAEVWPGIRSPY